jgi:benzoylformate decarboxylase
MADDVSGRDVLLDVLRSEGVRHIFGNPGSTELPLVDALAGADDLAYVLALQEATVVGMADGYAQATGGRPSSTCTPRPVSATPSAT